jgi:hypothetical protein
MDIACFTIPLFLIHLTSCCFLVILYLFAAGWIILSCYGLMRRSNLPATLSDSLHMLLILRPSWKQKKKFRRRHGIKFFVQKKIKHWVYRCYLWFVRPYPFQLWVAPRHSILSKWLAEKKDADTRNRHSPPGFVFKDTGEDKSDYAMFLYPDKLKFYWWMFFLVTVIFSSTTSREMSIGYQWGCGAVFFSVSYWLIYIILRRPVLDELWEDWPQTRNQKKYFKSIPSQTTFRFRGHFTEYHTFFRSDEKPVCGSLHSLWRKIFFLGCDESKSTPYFQRPVFYTPGKSLQEVILRTGTASFFAAKSKKSAVDILALIFYYFSHIWVSYIYLFLQLFCIFITGSRPGDNIVLRFVVPIILWAIITMFALINQFRFINGPLAKYDRELFLSAPPNLSEIIKIKMQTNRDTMKYLPKALSIIMGLTFVVYLTLVNLVLQCEPSKKKIVFQCSKSIQISVGK